MPLWSFLKGGCLGIGWSREGVGGEESCILYVSLLWVISVKGAAGHKIRKIKITGGRTKDCNGIASSLSYRQKSFFFFKTLFITLYNQKTKMMFLLWLKVLLSASGPTDNTMWAIFQIVSIAGKEFSITKARYWKQQKYMKGHNHQMSKWRLLFY